MSGGPENTFRCTLGGVGAREGTKIMNEKEKEKRWKEWASKPVACAASLVNLKPCRAATLCQQEKQLMLGAAGKGQRTGGVHDRQDGDRGLAEK